MSLDASDTVAPDAAVGDLRIQPQVSWPRAMAAGRPHLVEVDLSAVPSGGEWPFPQEEFAFTCVLDGGGQFDLWAVHDASVVVHRFGGSYGPAHFVVIPHDKAGDGSLWLTILNPWGISVSTHELEVTVSAADGEPPQEPVADIEIAYPDTTGQAGGDPGAASGELALAYPLPVSPETDGLPGRYEQVAVTVPDDVAATIPDVRVPPDAGTELAAAPSGSGGDDAARSPLALTDWYSLVSLRRSRSGTLELDLVPVFPPGTTSGERVQVTARCGRTDEHGTVFAVVAGPSGAADGLRLISAQSAKVPPGTYQVAIELLYPGQVRFHGLPAKLREDPRAWAEIVAAVPRRMAADTGPAHLITAIEMSGEDLVEARVTRVMRLIEEVATSAGDPVSYSVISYGPHSINENNRAYPEVPAETLAWAETPDAALNTLADLRRTRVLAAYTRAAQLECVLTDLAPELTGQEDRPVLVTAGARPAHPPHRDPVSEIIPCRRRRDWRSALRLLQDQHPGIAFGAIHDDGWPDEIWRLLGRDATTTLDEFYAPNFAASLGLTAGSGPLLPLPIITSAPPDGG